jgi:hypothetical protein
MAFIDRLTHRVTRACLYFFWTCVLLALGFCTFVGVKQVSEVRPVDVSPRRRFVAKRWTYDLELRAVNNEPQSWKESHGTAFSEHGSRT